MTNKWKNRTFILYTLFLTAFILRLILSITNYTYDSISNWRDAALYLGIGESFAAGDFFPQIGEHGYMHVAPGVPLLIALCIRIFGSGVYPMLVLNSIAGAAFVVVLYLIGEFFVGRKTAIVMAIWGTLNYGMMRFGFQLLKEPYIFLLLSLIVLNSARYIRYSGYKLEVVYVSIVLIALIHIDERYFYLVPPLLSLMYIVAAKRRQVRQIGYSMIVIVIMMLPWGVRNYHQFDEVVIVTTNLNSTLQKALGEKLLPTPRIVKEAPRNREFFERENVTTLEIENGRRLEWTGSIHNYFQAFVNHIRPSYIKGSWVYTLDGWALRKWSIAHNALGVMFYGIFLPFYLASLIWALFKRKLCLFMLFCLPIVNGLMHAVIPFPLERYRMATDFIVVLGAIWMINQIVLEVENVRYRSENVL